jgi:DivIVA domain-containing protein
MVILESVVDHGSSKADDRESHAPAPPEQGFGELRHYVPRDILDVSFPVSMRGYDRQAVDDHVKRVNRVIAELKVSASPPAAVRHALDQAGEKVESLLQAAREAGEEITASARQEAEEKTARAKAEAADLIVNTSADADRQRAEADEYSATARAEADETVAKAKAEAHEILAQATAEAHDDLSRAQAEADEHLRQLQEQLAAERDQAEARMREIQADSEALRNERRDLLEDVRRIASGLVDLANAAAARVPVPEATEPEEETHPPEAEDARESATVATDESATAVPAVGPQDGGDDETRVVR